MAKISEANIRINNKSNIDIVINTAPKSTAVADLDKRLTALENAGVDWDTINAKILAQIKTLDVVSSEELTEKLKDYLTISKATSEYATTVYVQNYVADAIKDIDVDPSDIDLTDYLKKSDAEQMYLKSGAVNALINTALASYYTKTETDTAIQNAIQGGQDLTNYYTKAEVDAAIEAVEIGEIDLSNYYTKSQINNLLQNFYTKSETDEQITAKIAAGKQVQFTVTSLTKDEYDNLTEIDGTMIYKVVDIDDSDLTNSAWIYLPKTSNYLDVQETFDGTKAVTMRFICNCGTTSRTIFWTPNWYITVTNDSVRVYATINYTRRLLAQHSQTTAGVEFIVTVDCANKTVKVNDSTYSMSYEPSTANYDEILVHASKLSDGTLNSEPSELWVNRILVTDSYQIYAKNIGLVDSVSGNCYNNTEYTYVIR